LENSAANVAVTGEFFGMASKIAVCFCIDTVEENKFTCVFCSTTHKFLYHFSFWASVAKQQL
jgi:hypothetical protein